MGTKGGFGVHPPRRIDRSSIVGQRGECAGDEGIVGAAVSTVTDGREASP